MKNKIYEFKNDVAASIFGISLKEAHSRKICVSCKEAITFPTEISEREYEISGLCDICFDNITLGE